MLSPTPSYAAALPAADEPDPRVNIWTALGVILGGYLMFFTGGIIRAVQLRDQVIPPTDYSRPVNIAGLGGRIGEMCGAALLLYLLCQWLRITRPMAGVPRRRASTIPSLLTTAAALAGLLVAAPVLAVLHRAPDPNALTGGALRNAWTIPGVIIDAVNAGVIEEIIIVAIPVLIGRRAGWHPAVIVAMSMLLRWPFHIYHGTWSSLPWAAIWGGAHVLAFLYLRRLAPLVIYHAVKDTIPSLNATEHQTLAAAVLIAYLLLLISYLYRAVTHRAGATDAALDRDPAAVAFFADRQRRGYWRTAMAVILCWAIGTLTAIELLDADAATAAACVAVGVVVLAGAVYWFSARHAAVKNLRTYRTDTGEVTAVAAWSTSYTGHVALSVTRENRRTHPAVELDVIRDVAAATRRTLSLFPSRAVYQLIAAHLNLGRRPITRRIRITSTQAAQLGQHTTLLTR